VLGLRKRSSPRRHAARSLSPKRSELSRPGRVRRSVRTGAHDIAARVPTRPAAGRHCVRVVASLVRQVVDHRDRRGRVDDAVERPRSRGGGRCERCVGVGPGPLRGDADEAWPR
jgi:hypothetical protein